MEAEKRGYPAAIACVLLGCLVSAHAAIPINGSETGMQSSPAIAINAAGTVLVGGYNDSAGIPTAGGTTYSASGVARSTDSGVTWAPVPVGPALDTGTLPTKTNGQLLGYPDVKYDPVNDRFFYSSLYIRPSDFAQGAAIHVSNSDGSSWNGPIEVGPTFISGHAGDKEFIDVNAMTGRLIVSWTDFGSSTAIRTTYSDNAGSTWSSATSLASTSTGLLQASVPRFLPAATNSTSTAYVVWRDGDTTTRNIGCARSQDGGATWSAALDLDAASFPVEDYLPGVDRPATSPAMAIDYSTGTVYVVYQRNDSVGTGHIALRSFVGSCAGGVPVILSAATGGTRAQFQPWVSVDQSSGNVHVIWYDQSHDASGDITEVMHTESKDHGATWSPPTALSERPFHAGYGNDTSQPNIGDYIQAVAQNGKLHALFGATAIEPHFDDGQPSPYLISPDIYYAVYDDSSNLAPLRLADTKLAEADCALNGNGYIDPGETIALTVTVQNYVTNAVVGAATLTNVNGTLSTTTAGVTITTNSASWPDLPAGAVGDSVTPFAFKTGSDFVAGTPIDFSLNLASAQGDATLVMRVSTGTPGTATSILSENFESVAPPALPIGWTAVSGAGTSDPWITASPATESGFLSTNFAFHDEGTAANWQRLWSPALAVPSVSGPAYITLDYDLAYRLQDDPSKLVEAYDGVTVRIFDSTAGATARSVLAEAFAQQLTTGGVNFLPKHLPRSSNTSYFQDMSVWSGDSQGATHVAMQFPALGLEGRTVQLRFEYTQDGSGTCATAGYSAPCGIGLDNIVLKLVPLVANTCVLTSDLIFRNGFDP